MIKPSRFFLVGVFLLTTLLSSCVTPEKTICNAVFDEDVDALCNAISEDVDVKKLQCTEPFSSPVNVLLHVVHAKRVDMAECLLKTGANVWAYDNFGFTPIHHAAGNGDVEMICLLHQFGSDINVEMYNEFYEGPTPLSYTPSYFYGSTPLFLAVAHKRMETIRLLLSLGADPNIRTSKGTNILWYVFPLDCANCPSDERRFEIFKVLLEHGARTDFVDVDGKTITDIASECNEPEFIELIKNADTIRENALEAKESIYGEGYTAQGRLQEALISERKAPERHERWQCREPYKPAVCAR